jgi:spore coat polysaccharide biosynthesis predicted glycosyltransferase SpsG
MFAICIEASHSKGMGHLFRMLNFVKYLKYKDEKFIVLINDNDKTKYILEANKISFEVVGLKGFTSNWETSIIEKYNIKYWINDRLDTEERHSLNVKKNSIKLITFDDIGSGAKSSDINICGLFFNNDNLHGKKILKGVQYLILNDEIDKYKRERIEIKKILVTLGGSDTYGVTIKILRLLKKYKIKATIHTGISFEHKKELEKELTQEYIHISHVTSFIEEFSKYDLAITGGGVTPFEANASGLPCLVVANELFEIPNGKFLDDIGSSKFMGYYDNINEIILSNLENLDIKKLSKNGMQNLNTQAVEKIYKEIKNNE